MHKPKVGIYGLTSCAGDQLVLLNCEDELLDIVAAVDLRSFIMAQSGATEAELDVAFVEGAVAQQRDLAALRDIRSRSALVVAIGTCAVWGGVPAMRNDLDRTALQESVYGADRPEPKPGFYESLQADSLAKYVKVDLAIPGCPIEKDQILRGLASLLHGDLPLLARHPVCAECKMNEYTCLLQHEGRLCCGPLTLGGCQARCPGHNRPCLGCRGPVDDPNVAGEYRILLEKGFTLEDIRSRLRTFAGSAGLTGFESPAKEGTR